ncbi:hypothetical protein [Microterricola viridarii]|nr:hypothetical protein [Microterricola viridarii]
MPHKDLDDGLGLAVSERDFRRRRKVRRGKGCPGPAAEGEGAAR